LVATIGNHLGHDLDLGGPCVVILIFAILILSFLVVAIGDRPNRGRDLDFGGPHPFSLLVKSSGDPRDLPKP
jgi:hypothetical protein